MGKGLLVLGRGTWDESEGARGERGCKKHEGTRQREREIVRTQGTDVRNFIAGNVPPETISETPIDRRTKLRASRAANF